jgi:sortase (surface protein transpeptidase)
VAARAGALELLDNMLQGETERQLLERLDEVKKGDQIVVRHTETIAFSVRKP